ncbi:hypothetical protein BC938DRAFT_472200, partial [Jimgerdemannia flammicorona]
NKEVRHTAGRVKRIKNGREGKPALSAHSSEHRAASEKSFSPSNSFLVPRSKSRKRALYTVDDNYRHHYHHYQTRFSRPRLTTLHHSDTPPPLPPPVKPKVDFYYAPKSRTAKDDDTDPVCQVNDGDNGCGIKEYTRRDCRKEDKENARTRMKIKEITKKKKRQPLMASSQIMQLKASRQDKKLGIFNKGKASAKVQPKGVPDLVFSEMHFLDTTKPTHAATDDADDDASGDHGLLRRGKDDGASNQPVWDMAGTRPSDTVNIDTRRLSRYFRSKEKRNGTKTDASAPKKDNTGVSETSLPPTNYGMRKHGGTGAPEEDDDFDPPLTRRKRGACTVDGRVQSKYFTGPGVEGVSCEEKEHAEEKAEELPTRDRRGEEKNCQDHVAGHGEGSADVTEGQKNMEDRNQEGTKEREKAETIGQKSSDGILQMCGPGDALEKDSMALKSGDMQSMQKENKLVSARAPDKISPATSSTDRLNRLVHACEEGRLDEERDVVAKKPSSKKRKSARETRPRDDVNGLLNMIEKCVHESNYQRNRGERHHAARVLSGSPGSRRADGLVYDVEFPCNCGPVNDASFFSPDFPRPRLFSYHSPNYEIANAPDGFADESRYHVMVDNATVCTRSPRVCAVDSEDGQISFQEGLITEPGFCTREIDDSHAYDSTYDYGIREGEDAQLYLDDHPVDDEPCVLLDRSDRTILDNDTVVFQFSQFPQNATTALDAYQPWHNSRSSFGHNDMMPIADEPFDLSIMPSSGFDEDLGIADYTRPLGMSTNDVDDGRSVIMKREGGVAWQAARGVGVDTKYLWRRHRLF